MSFNSRKNLKQNNSNNDDGGGGVIISGQAKKISAGQDTAFAIDSNDRLIAWGEYGEIFDEYSTPTDVKHIPEQRSVYGSYYDGYIYIGLDSRVKTSDFFVYSFPTATDVIDAGYNSEYLWYLKSDGTLKIYYAGYLHDLNHTTHKTFNSVSKCSINMFYGIILKTDGTLHTWPYTEYAGNVVQYNSSLPSNLNNIKDISCGSLNPTILKHSGEIVEWGTFPHRTQARIPKPNINNAIKISAGFSHTLALLDNGTVVGWGFNNDNQLDIPTGLSNIIDISAGYNYSMALRSDGKIICWGNNAFNLCNVPERLRADLKTTKKITDYNTQDKKVYFLNSNITVNFADFGYNQGELNTGADKFNFALSFPKAITDDYYNNQLGSNAFIIGGNNYFYSRTNNFGQDVFSIWEAGSVKNTSINTEFSKSQYSRGNSLIGNYFFYEQNSYPYTIFRYINGSSLGGATFNDAIFLKNTSDPDYNNSLIIVGNFTLRKQIDYRNNTRIESVVETSNFYISDERGYQSDSHEFFNSGFNFSTSEYYNSTYKNTKIRNYEYNSDNISYKSSRTIRTIKQYKKDYIIFGDDNGGLSFFSSPNFYVRSLGVNGATLYAWHFSGNTYLNFWIGVFKTTSSYLGLGDSLSCFAGRLQ
jgi:hypothetical protein